MDISGYNMYYIYMSELHERLYNYAIYISYILYALALFGLSNYAPEYLDLLRDFIKLYISLVLIVKFNPFTHKSTYMSTFDKKLVFSSGVFLLLTTSITTIVEKYVINIVNKTPLYDNKFINRFTNQNANM